MSKLENYLLALSQNPDGANFRVDGMTHFTAESRGYITKIRGKNITYAITPEGMKFIDHLLPKVSEDDIVVEDVPPIPEPIAGAEAPVKKSKKKRK